MHRHHARSHIEILNTLEARCLQHLLQRLLIRVHADGFGQVLITGDFIDCCFLMRIIVPFDQRVAKSVPPLDTYKRGGMA